MAEPRFWMREYFEALLIAGVFLFFSNTFLVKTFFIPSGSMEETLLIGDHLFVNRFIFGQGGDMGEVAPLPARDIQRGDIVIFRSPQSPETDLVKRCVGIPGDEIRIDRKALYINGQEVDDRAYTVHKDARTYPASKVFSRQLRLRDNLATVTVPEDEYFFLGDNRDESYDSRYWGFVPRHYIKGRALMVYWSYAGETPDGRWTSWRDRIVQLGKTIAGFFSKTRWRRTFHLIE